MNSKYLITFSKKGLLKYISHLDLLRLFKRTITRAGIELDFSQGFNPHPKMVFGQPLSLGFTASEEILEIETRKSYEENFIKNSLNNLLPESIRIIECVKSDEVKGSISSRVYEAEYTAVLPLDWECFGEKINDLRVDYLNQNEILAFKRQKKSKKMVEKNIKDQIRSMGCVNIEGKVGLTMTLDCGSKSNLNPDLVVKSFIDFGKLEIQSYQVNINRDKLAY